MINHHQAKVSSLYHPLVSRVSVTQVENDEEEGGCEKEREKKKVSMRETKNDRQQPSQKSMVVSK